MTEPTGEAVTAEGAARRGRPRPDVTIQRDQQVLNALDGPKTRAQLIEATGLSKNQVYLSLYRLRKDGHVVRDRQGALHVWSRVAA